MREETNETWALEREGCDAVLPSQLLRLSAPYDRVPEARLALAVIEDAVLTLQLAARVRTPRARMLAAQAMLWISSDDAHESFGFVALCDYIGLDAGWLRQGLRRAGILHASRTPERFVARRRARSAA